MRYYSLLLSISLIMPSILWAQSELEYRHLSLKEADSLLLSNNKTLMIKEAEVMEADGGLRQSRAGENPEISILHNVKNPASGKYFDFSKEGETDIQLSQRIFIGGQRRNAVRRSAAMLNASEAERSWTRRELRSMLVKGMATVDGLIRKDSLYATQIAMLQRVVDAHSASASNGNISKLELSKIRAMLYLAESNRHENRAKLLDEESRLISLLGTDYAILPLLPKVEKGEMESLIRELPKIEQRSDIEQYNHLVEAAKRDVSLQRSNALPEISLTAEWDKNGNIGHNFFGIGATITLPLANRNRGNIAMAKARHTQAVIAQQQLIMNADIEISRLQKEVESLLPLALSSSIEEHELMLTHAEEQYIRRNISMQEFSMIFETFSETVNLFIDNNVNLFIAIEDLKKAKGL